MAKFKQGINGPFSGKIGNVIGSSWRGIPYMKSISKKSAKERSPGQLQNQYIFGLVCKWLHPLLEYVREGFRDPLKPKRGLIAAKSHLHHNALVREGYDSYIIPSQVLISRGSLPQAAELSMSFNTASNEIEIRWNTEKTDNPADNPGASFNDQLMYVAYNVEDQVTSGQVFGPLRIHGHCRIPLSPYVKGKYHVYVAFHSADRKNQSDSRYLGEVKVG